MRAISAERWPAGILAGTASSCPPLELFTIRSSSVKCQVCSAAGARSVLLRQLVVHGDVAAGRLVPTPTAAVGHHGRAQRGPALGLAARAGRRRVGGRLGGCAVFSPSCSCTGTSTGRQPLHVACSHARPCLPPPALGMHTPRVRPQYHLRYMDRARSRAEKRLSASMPSNTKPLGTGPSPLSCGAGGRGGGGGGQLGHSLHLPPPLLRKPAVQSSGQRISLVRMLACAPLPTSLTVSASPPVERTTGTAP